MSVQKIFTSLLASAALGLLAFKPDSFCLAAVAVASVMAFCVTVFVEHEQDARVAKFQDQLIDLKNKIEAIQLGRGFGR